MFGCLTKDITIEDHSRYFIGKKSAAEGHRIFEQAIALPDFPEKIINMIVREPYKDQDFIDTNKQQIEFLSETIRDVKSFIQVIKFDSDSNDQADRLLAAERT